MATRRNGQPGHVHQLTKQTIDDLKRFELDYKRHRKDLLVTGKWYTGFLVLNVAIVLYGVGQWWTDPQTHQASLFASIFLHPVLLVSSLFLMLGHRRYWEKIMSPKNDLMSFNRVLAKFNMSYSEEAETLIIPKLGASQPLWRTTSTGTGLGRGASTGQNGNRLRQAQTVTLGQGENAHNTSASEFVAPSPLPFYPHAAPTGMASRAHT